MATYDRPKLLTVDEVMKLARERTDELFEVIGSRVPEEVRRELSAGVEAILQDVVNQRPWCREGIAFVSTADAAKLLFVSRPHVVKLIEQGKLKLSHMTGNNRFVLMTSVEEYQAERKAAAQAYRNTAGESEE